MADIVQCFIERIRRPQYEPHHVRALVSGSPGHDRTVDREDIRIFLDISIAGNHIRSGSYFSYEATADECWPCGPITAACTSIQLYLTKLRYEASASISSGPRWLQPSASETPCRNDILDPIAQAGLLEVAIGEFPQARNISHALGVRAVTGIAGHDVGFRSSLQCRRHWRRHRCKIISQVACRMRMQSSDRSTCIASKMDCPARARENSESGSSPLGPSSRGATVSPCGWISSAIYAISSPCRPHSSYSASDRTPSHSAQMPVGQSDHGLFGLRQFREQPA
jgi:hypothetical protein